MKPQIALGLTFNWGAFMGYSAVTDEMNLAIQLPLYVSCVMWTVLYDTIYAKQDLADDLKLGLNTSANNRWDYLLNSQKAGRLQISCTILRNHIYF